MKILYPTVDVANVTLANGAQVVVRKGQHWHADDQVCREKPELFSEDPRYGVQFTGEPPAELCEPPVETATANPGERRSARRGTS